MLLWTIVVADAGIVLSLIFGGRREPGSVVTWSLAVVALPIAGIVLYILFGVHYFHSRKFAAKALSDKSRLANEFEESNQRTLIGSLRPGAPENEDFLGVVDMLATGNQSYLTADNRVDVFTDGTAFFDALLGAINGAKQYIHMEYYIVRNDDTGRKLLDALARRATEGLIVRFLYDNLGNKVPRRVYKRLRRAGVQAAAFYPTPLPFLSLRLNYRNHRKIAVVDGTVAFVGGFNIGNEYVGKGPLGYWRDTGARIIGPAAKPLNTRFILDWIFATGRPTQDPKLSTAPDSRYHPEPAGPASEMVQVVSGGPDTPPWNAIKEEYLKLIATARKTLYIQTPYFIPDFAVLDAIKIAALSGVDVRVMIPHQADAPLVRWVGYSLLGELLQLHPRIRVYEYRLSHEKKEGFLHAKTATVDGFISSIGSGNWDIRSFTWNFESNVVIYGSEFGKQQIDIFTSDMQNCDELTPQVYWARPLLVKLKERISRLFYAAL